jgi:hypothetical protein
MTCGRIAFSTGEQSRQERPGVSVVELLVVNVMTVARTYRAEPIVQARSLCFGLMTAGKSDQSAERSRKRGHCSPQD